MLDHVCLNDDDDEDDDDRFLDLGPAIVSAIRKRMRMELNRIK